MRRSLTRARRGVTLPFVCIMLTALIGATAMAIDIGRLYYAATEVQTAADAAALAAARAQQYYPKSGLQNVQGSAQWIASLNKANGQAVSLQGQDVVPVSYDPTTRSISSTTYTETTGAFTVTAQTVVPQILAGGSHTVRRSATAWVANVNGGTCVRPLAINYTRFYEEGVTYDNRFSSIGAYAPDFDLWDIASTQYAPLPGRTFIVLPPGANKLWWLAARGLYSHANWQPADLSSGGTQGLTNALATPEGGAYCASNRAVVGDVDQPVKSDSASIVNAANLGMISLCHRVGNAPNAYCYNKDGTIGVKTRIMLADSLPGAAGSGKFTLKVREVGRARVMCYFQSTADVCAYLQMNELAANGTWCYYAHAFCDGTNKGYPPGTMMVFLDTPGSTDLTSDLVLGTKPGLTQRVLLAK